MIRKKTYTLKNTPQSVTGFLDGDDLASTYKGLRDLGLLVETQEGHWAHNQQEAAKLARQQSNTLGAIACKICQLEPLNRDFSETGILPVPTAQTKSRIDEAKELGVKWFLFDGPDDEVTCDWCRAFVGTRVTVEILREHANSFGRDPCFQPAEYWLCGVRSEEDWFEPCRHELVPLIKDKKSSRYPIGPRDRGPRPVEDDEFE